MAIKPTFMPDGPGTYHLPAFKRDLKSLSCILPYMQWLTLVPWIKAFHIIFMVTWFAGLFYLPRLFVYHAMAQDEISRERFKVMERRLFVGIMTPGGLLTVFFGIWMLVPGWNAYASAGWMHAKLTLVAILAAYHVYLGRLLLDFARDRNRHSQVYYRWINELPTVILIAVVILVVVKPF